ncbi:hypothetical protein JM79_2151 [Gramella sp. Hel_I_59]|uniref:hypothetical protein n=1 Tax=Gramella sp. Hel_I_59 TaxID=1249978 RepID=UPI00114F33EE|nr:hypothetical protein [Gramella sp. Hel_I_59]TQI71224.1 hypothetical protein JM79_2151 [Gramella sp. Hel_I_59]
MKYVKSSFLIAIILFFISSCAEEENVIITNNYIINPNWDKVDNSLLLERMIVKDGETINISNLDPSELFEKLKTDTSFAFTANVHHNGVDYSKRKIYFNKENGFKWRKRPDLDPSRNFTLTTLGKLEQNTWYFLGGLSKIKTLYYIYIDSSNKLHQFRVPAVHWTNI